MFKVIYVKWILRHCPHFCTFCKFNSEMKCKDEFRHYTWKELKQMKRIGGYNG